MKNSYTLALTVVLTTTSVDAFSASSVSTATTTQKPLHWGSGPRETGPSASATKSTEKGNKTAKNRKNGTVKGIVSLDEVVEAAIEAEDHVKISNEPLMTHDQEPSTFARKPISDLKLGSFVDGHVAHFAPFGVFVKTDYAVRGGCALLHKSQISAKNWSTGLHRGESIRARVVSVNYETMQVGLSLLEEETDEMMEFADVEIGQEIPKAVVRHITDYGVFVDVQCRGVNALVHKSRVPNWGRRDDGSRLWVGQEVPVRIIGKNDLRSTLEASMLTLEQDDYLNRHWAALKAVRERRERFAEQQYQDEEHLPINEESIDLFTEAIEELKDVILLN